MKYTQIAKSINYFHKLVTYYSILFPYITPINYMIYSSIWMFGVICHWYFLDGRCFLSVLEDKFKDKEEPKTSMFKFLEIYGIPSYSFDLLLHFNMLFSFYQLNLFYYGIITQSFIICSNYIIYGNWKFKNSI